ncbi:MAG: ribosome-associated translation inhibitor RaiA [Dehalococcoidia bacterium]|nr:ribosome-associated translation inhibitor RaiA [Dehalococcoidia bacterium]
MDLQVTGHNVEILPTVKSYLDKKLTKLNRHLPNLMGAKVELTEQKIRSQEKRFRAQVTLVANGTILRAEEQAETLLAAIDKVVPALDRQIEKYKGKLYKKSKAGIAARAQNQLQEMAAETELVPGVIRTKRFPVKLMTTEEAVDQMELLGHDFFLFHNAATRELNLIYKRKDGNYSIIEPVLE